MRPFHLFRSLKYLCGVPVLVLSVQIVCATPVAVPVHIWVDGTGSGSQTLSVSGTFLESAPGATDGFGTDSITGAGALVADLDMVRAEPGRSYQVQISGTATPVAINVAPPPGFFAEIEGIVRNRYLTGYGMVVVRVLPHAAAAPRKASTDVTDAAGKVDWRVSLGSLRNGGSAGELSLIDAGFHTSWAALFTPALLDFEPPSAEVDVYRVSNSIRQVIANETVVDVVTLSSTAYEIRFYNPSQMQGTTSPRTFTGQPYTVYKVEKGATATSLKITRKTYNITSATVTGIAAARSEVMLIERSGTTWPNFDWTHTPWTTEGQTALTQRYVDSGGTNAARTESAAIRIPGSLAVLKASRNFAVQPWGETMISETLGTTNSSTANYDYYTASTQAGYTYVKSWTSNSGDWEAYQYYDQVADPKRSGAIKFCFRPFLDSPTTANFTAGLGEITQYDYAADAFGFFTRPTLAETKVNGTVTTRSTTAYTEALVNGMQVVTAVRKDYSDATNFLPSTTRYYREDIEDPFFRKQLYSVVDASGVKTAYVYQRGTWSGTTAFTISGTNGLGAGTASRIAVITGTTSSTAGTLYSALAGYDVDDLYLVAGKSTMVVTYRDSRALVVRTVNEVWGGSAWQTLNYTDNTYDFVGRLISRTISTRPLYDASYNGNLLISETDESGMVLNYTYDVMGRRKTVAKVSGPTTTFTLDATGRVLTEVLSGTGAPETIVTSRTYDDSGRLTSTTPPGLSATTFSYNVPNRTRITTAPDGGTTVETAFRDGRPKDVTGTATVAQYYTHTIETDGRRLTRINHGTATSPRLQKTWADWLGRAVTTEKPGYSVSSQAASIDQNFYHSSTGRLTKSTRTGFAPTLYEYDALGNVIRSGLDIDTPGSLVLASADRITETTTVAELYAGEWWSKTETKSYLNATPFTTSVTRTRLKGHPANRLAETQAIDAEGNVTTTVVDLNRSTKTVTTTTTRTGVSGSQVQVTVNGFMTRTIGHDTLATAFEYDPLGRPWKTTNSRGNTTTQAYVLGTSLVYSATDADSNILSRTGYDANGRVAWTQDAAGQLTYRAYTLRGQLSRQWGAASYPIEYGYDPIYGEQVSMSTFRAGTGWTNVTWPAASIGTADATTWTFDSASGLLRRKTDASGRSVDYDYNQRGQTTTRDWARLVASGPNAGQRVRTSYGFNALTGEFTGQTYNDGTPAVSYAYNRLGQTESVTDVTGTWDYIYDAAKPWRQSATGLPAFFGSRVYTLLYEGTGVVGRNTGFQLGATAGSTADFEQRYTYTGAGRFDTLATKRTNNTVARTFQYGYEANAPLVNTLSIAGSHPFTVTRGYELKRDLLTSIDSKWSTTSRTRFEYGHNPLYQRVYNLQSGDVFADYGDKTFHRYVYNARGELTQAPGYLGGNTNTTTQALPGRFHEYDYDSIGNRKSTNRTGVAALKEDYTANSLNQYSDKENNTIPVQGTVDSTATTVTVSGGAASAGKQGRYWGDEITVNNSTGPWAGPISLYASKPNTGGNFVRSASRMAQIAKAVQTFTYDLDGNLTSDGMWDYQYDAENRLIRMETSLGARTFGIPHRVLEYRYDFQHRRVQKRVVNGASAAELSSRRYLYSGWNLLAEWNAPGGTTLGTLVRSYTWGLDLTGSLTAAGGVGALLQITDHASGKTYLPTYDGIGNVTALLDGASGTLAAAYEYDPFGNFLRNAVLDTVVADQPFKFSTKFTDQETGFLYYGRRYYSPSLGRFYGRDPIGEKGGPNLYGFVNNNAVNSYDVLGMCPYGQYDNPVGGCHHLFGWAPELGPSMDNSMNSAFFGLEFDNYFQFASSIPTPTTPLPLTSLEATIQEQQQARRDSQAYKQGQVDQILNNFNATAQNITSGIGGMFTNIVLPQAAIGSSPPSVVPGNATSEVYSADPNNAAGSVLGDIVSSFSLDNPYNPVTILNNVGLRGLGAAEEATQIYNEVVDTVVRGMGGSHAEVHIVQFWGPLAVTQGIGMLSRFAPLTAGSGVPSALRAGQLAEGPALNAIGSSGKVAFTPTSQHIESAAFKLIVGDVKYTPSGQPVSTIFDGLTDPGLAEIKSGSSVLNSSYQLRLQTYYSLIMEEPFTIYTSRPVNSQFADWLTRWGVSVKPLP